MKPAGRNGSTCSGQCAAVLQSPLIVCNVEFVQGLYDLLSCGFWMRQVVQVPTVRFQDRGGVAGGRGDHRGGGRGGPVMTGRQKMNEKSMRRGGMGRDMMRGGRGGMGYRDEMRFLQSQLQLNTYELQRQIASLRGGRDRGYGGGFRDFPPDPYGPPPPPMGGG